jgi:hypothetical protein
VRTFLDSSVLVAVAAGAVRLVVSDELEEKYGWTVTRLPAPPHRPITRSSPAKTSSTFPGASAHLRS